MKKKKGNEENNSAENTPKKKNKNEGALVTKESLGAVGALFSVLAFLILLTRSLIFGAIGVAVNAFLLGTFGYAAYLVVPVVFLLSLSAFIDKKIIKNAFAVTCVLLIALFVLLIVHAIVTLSWAREGYFAACFDAAADGVKGCTPAGVLGGLIVGTLFVVAGKVGTFVIFALVLLCLALLLSKAVFGKTFFSALFSKKKKAAKNGAENTENNGQNGYGANGQNSTPFAQPYGQDSYGQSGYGANGQNSTPFAQPYGQDSYGQSGYGANGQNSTSFAQPYGQDGYGQNGYGSNGQNSSAYPFADFSRVGESAAADGNGGASYAANGQNSAPFYGGENGYAPCENAYAAQNREGASAQSAAYEKYNEYGFPSDNVRQRPGVRLTKDLPTEQPTFNGYNGVGASEGFSPFAAPSKQGGEASTNANAQPTGREWIYGADPIESFRNNLIFDPNSKFNQRQSAVNQPLPSFQTKPQNTTGGRAASSGFGGSYTNAYAESVNDDRVRERRTGTDSDFSSANGGYARETSDFAPPSDRDTAQNGNNLPQNNGYGFGGTGANDFTPSREQTRYDDAPFTPSREEARYNDTPFTSSREETGYNDTPFTPSREETGYNGTAFTPSREQTRYDDAPFTPSRTENSDGYAETTRNSSDFGRRDEADDRLTIFDDEEETYSFDREDGLETRDAFSGDASREFSRGEDGGRFPSETGGRDDFGRESSGRDDFSTQSREQSGISRESAFSSRDASAARNDYAPRGETPPERVQPQPPQPPKPRVIRPYRSAPLDYFDCTETRPDQNSVEIEENKQTILDTLEAFKVPDATIASVTCGPTVTRYNVAVPRNISPKKVVALDQPIAMNLHAKNGVNIAPNFEDGTISVEVPNQKRQTVTLGSMIAAEEFINSKPNALVFAMGKTVGNKKEYGDIRKMTHILVAGTSGSGKTAFLHSIIISLIMKYSPTDLRLILIDPKKTEFVVYEGLPHLVINEVLSDTNKVIQSLNWAIGEMERRYDLFNKKSRAGTYVINIDEYNANLSEGEEKLPKIVIIADEVAAMMQDAKKDMEDRIQNLTQKSRATGIHVILATQRPSTDVITGVIKSNLKSRIALSVAQEIDSRVILDESGAQNLLGQGDLLYSTEGLKTPVRMQAPFISSEKAQEVIQYIKENNDCYFNEEAAAYIDKPKGQTGYGVPFGNEQDEVDEVYVEALRNVILSGSASISLVQRKCSVGYNKAGKIIEWMEDQGYISAFDGAKARKVLITPDQFEEKFGPL